MVDGSAWSQGCWHPGSGPLFPWLVYTVLISPQALAVKIFVLMPISMVEEHAVSVTTWIKSAKQSWQSVATVSDHLQIWQFEQSDVQNVLSFIYTLQIIYIWHVWIFLHHQDRQKNLCQSSGVTCSPQSINHFRRQTLSLVKLKSLVMKFLIWQLRILLTLPMDLSGSMIAFCYSQ